MSRQKLRGSESCPPHADRIGSPTSLRSAPRSHTRADFSAAPATRARHKIRWIAAGRLLSLSGFTNSCGATSPSEARTHRARDVANPDTIELLASTSTSTASARLLTAIHQPRGPNLKRFPNSTRNAGSVSLSVCWDHPGLKLRKPCTEDTDARDSHIRGGLGGGE